MSAVKEISLPQNYLTNIIVKNEEQELNTLLANKIRQTATFNSLLSKINRETFQSPIFENTKTTHLRCGVIFKYESVANLPATLSVKRFWKLVNIWGSYGQVLSRFSAHGVQ